MKKLLRTRALLLAVLVLSFPFICMSQKPATNTFSAGFAKINITPDYPVPMSGYGDRKDPSKGIHDSLYVRAAAFFDGTNNALLISADVIGFSHDLWKEVAEKIEKDLNIKKEFVMLAAVHNHSGPVTRVYNEDSSGSVIRFVGELKEKILTASREALNSLSPASIGIGKGVCKMNINRRASNGKGQTTLGRNPYAPCDNEVAVIKLMDESKNPKGIIVNWPCHATTLGQNNYLITSDWPGAAAKYLEDNFEGDIIAPITVGASGDINPIYGPGDFDNGYTFAKDAVGEDLAVETIRIAKEIKTESAAKIRSMQREIYLPRKKPSSSDTSGARAGYNNDSVLIRLSLLRIGKIVLAGVSGEVFNQISVKMRKKSPFPFTVMITHCNGSSGYLVTDDAYPDDNLPQMQDKRMPRGGYETTTTRVSSGAEKAIIENLLDMMHGL
jgi:neutral ceramidase